MRPHLPFRDHAPTGSATAQPWSVLLAAITVTFLPGALLPSPLSAQQLPSALPSSSAQLQPGQTTAPPSHPPHHSQVTLDHGLLSVTASNASLNGLLREIARQTGMSVSGTVAEDRVFGTYGPADPQRVLSDLLDGTGSNILIRSNAADAPLQLILTPRTGAATPPNPNANQGANDDDDEQTPSPGAPTAVSAPRARPAVMPGSIPAPDANAAAPANAISPASPSPSQTVVFPPAGGGSSIPATATTTSPDTDTPSPGSSANDTVKTPQQIFEQLQRLRQQNTTGQGNTTAPQ
jgi:hypothetical protein